MPKIKKLTFDVTENGCFVCTSHKTVVKKKNCNHAHSRIKRNGKHIYLHRFIYEEMFGEIPEGQVVRHKCDNGLCINPEHMELGTHKENMNDMVVRGRSCKGDRNGKAVLNEDQVRQIRKRMKEGQRATELSQEFGVSRPTIYRINNKKLWGHVL